MPEIAAACEMILLSLPDGKAVAAVVGQLSASFARSVRGG